MLTPGSRPSILIAMNKTLARMLLVVMLSIFGTTYADETPPADQPLEDELGFSDEAPDAEELEGAEELPLELDTVSVEGVGLSYSQEVALRIVRQAYNAPRSDRHEDIDNWVCWLSAPTGTHFKHLNCARNGDLWSLRPRNIGGKMVAGIPIAGYGKIFSSEHPANRRKLENAMAALPGSSDFDREFVGMVMAGQEPDRDIPNDEELGQFVQAFVKLGKMQNAGKSDDEQIAAIEKEGLSLKRYNRIAELTESYQSVENQVDERIKNLK
jgi:hypothetical protein